MADNEDARRANRQPEPLPEPQAQAQGDGNNGRKRRRRSRRRRGGRGDPLAPVTRPRRLNFDLPVTEPLAPDEQREMTEHLSFLRQFKPYLGLSLNAAEDLLVEGSHPPTDRGVCKHLLSKLDRRCVERALGREAVRTDAALRARLLAGIVPITPEVGTLLAYLEALTWVADKRDAAAAFGATIDRIDFGTVSATQMAALLDVINKTFEGHERIQALFGLLSSDSFAGALGRTLDALPAGLRAVFAPLSAAHRAVLGRMLPRNLDERTLVEQGVRTWLGAPDRVLKGYPAETRRRLIEYALGEVDISAIAKPARILVDSLPREDPACAELGIALADRLLASRQDEQARGLLNVILQGHPTLGAAKRRQEVLSWPRLGRLALAPSPRGAGRLRRAFWLDLPGFVWARMAPAADAARLGAEAHLQASLVTAGVAACLGHGTAADGTPYVLLAPGGRLLEPAMVRGWSLRDALTFAREGVLILHGLAFAGVDLPDASIERFVSDRVPVSLRLLDLDGALRKPPDACLARSGALVTALCRQLLPARDHGGLRRDLPAELGALLRDQACALDLARALATHAARAWDRAAGDLAELDDRPAT